MARSQPAQPPAQGDTWTTRRLLAWMGERFGERGLDSPRLSAEMLLTHVLASPRLSLYTDPDRPASDAERERLRELVARALRHEPIQYLVGEAWFFGLPFEVNRDVLIPRPSTESLVEAALTWLRQRAHVEGEASHGEHEERAEKQEGEQGEEREGQVADPPADEALERGRPQRLVRVADIGTGSGAIAVAIAVNRPETRLVATDISEPALEAARRNAERHGVSTRIDFRAGDLFAPLSREEPFDLIASNPPYIPDDEWPQVEPNVRQHEPASALRAGADGLAVIRPLLTSAPRQLRPGGLLLLEHAAAHAAEVRHLAEATGVFESLETVSDLEGHPRFLRAKRAAP